MRNILLPSLFLFFPLISFTQSFTSSNLPIVIIQTDINPSNGEPYEIPDDPKVLASMKIINHPDGSRNYITDQSDTNLLNYNGRIAIEKRGSSSQELPKKPYGLTTLNDDDISNNNVSILGMPKENDWILNSLAFDATLIRNYLSYNLSRNLGNYAPRCVYCEVVINGDYMGLYLFMEKIKIDADRVNIIKMTSSDNTIPDVTGGYIIKSDKTTGGDPVAWSMASYAGYTDFLHESPKPSDITTKQKNYIHDQFTDLEDATAANNASKSNGYPSIIDIPSFVDYMLICEISSNADSYQYSTYFHKDRGGKLRAGPVWDYDLTYGNDLFFWGYDRSHTDVWQFNDGGNTGAKFWKDLYDNTTFKCYLTKRWKALNAEGNPLNYTTIANLMDDAVDLISEAIVREENRWGTIGNHSNELIAMKDWLQERIIWLNGKLTNYSACADPWVPPLVISKIDYHPAETMGLLSDDLEFIEISNNGNEPVDLTGIYFMELGISYQFPAQSTVKANKKIYLASNASAFQQFYGFLPHGEFIRELSNKSQKLILADAFGNIIDYVEYMDDEPWPLEADGDGYYLELDGLDTDNSKASNWFASDFALADIQTDLIQSSVILFPNPGHEVLNITIAGNLQNPVLTLYSVSGQKLLSRLMMHGQAVVSTEMLPKGLYVWEVETKGEVIERGKWVKQ